MNFNFRLLSIGVVCLSVPVLASYWFAQAHVGWLIERVASPVEYAEGWQDWLNEQVDIQHPAVIHYLPEKCICSALTQKHAQIVSENANNKGFYVYQLLQSATGLGATLDFSPDTSPDTSPNIGASLQTKAIAPMVLITRKSGEIRYLGPYSEGLLCNSGSSLISSFINTADNNAGPPVIELNVKTCLCGDK